MVHESCIPLDAPSEWKNALEGIVHTFAHTWENAYAMHLTTGYNTYLYHFEAGDVRIVCPVAERTFEGHADVVTPYGVSGFAGNEPYPAFPGYWRRFTQQKGYVCGFISMHPLCGNGTYFAPDEADVYNVIYVVDLSRPTSELFAGLSTNRRRQIRKGVDHAGVVLERERLAEFFLTHYHDFMARKGASPVYQFSEETLSFLVNLENVFMVGAQNSSRELDSVALFAYTEYVATYLFSVTLPAARSRSGSLIWYGMTHARSLRIRWMDLGGGIRRGDTVAEFKRRFGGDELPLGALKQVYDRELFERLCRRMKVAPGRPGYFPPYHAS